RVAGRIFGYLLICDPPYQTPGQLVVRLRISKGAVSGMMRLLTQSGMVEEFFLPGVRSRNYRVRVGGWEDLFVKHLQRLSMVRDVLGEGRLLMKGKDPGLAARIDELDSFCAFFGSEIPLLVERWKGEKPQDHRKN
ncbi:MAG: hypothetical protein LUQ01_03560, partial [Methanolinea sp.]|nr:hypothetical protein [Methanolinea sp.]